ncbi:MAG: TonB-dependent receptor [Parvibaculaceae bacterium]|nr:TonB-dependent receptor [Parvibaculaceae bacterium]
MTFRNRYLSSASSAAICCALATLFTTAPHSASAQGEPTTTLTAPVQDSGVTYSIAAQPLSSALAAFGRQSALQISADAEILRGLKAPALDTRMSKTQALKHLLSGTGLIWRQNGTTIIINRVESGDASGGSLKLDPIIVTTSRPDTDVPFSTPGAVAHISSEQIARRVGLSPGDIFKGTPGVIAATNHNGDQLDVNIRGMQGQNRVKVAIDGTQQTSTTWRGYVGVDERVYLDPSMIASVDITKGPNGSAEAAGTPSGVVSIRTLRAKDIVQEGETSGWRIKVGTHDNAIQAPDSTPLNPEYDQRDHAPGLFKDSNYSGSLAYGYTGETFDFLLAYAQRKRGNYFAGKHGDTTTSPPFNNINYDLTFTKPGEEVFNTSSESRSVMTKLSFYLPNSQAVEFGYSRYEANYGEAMGSLLLQQDNGYRQVQLSDITTETYTLQYLWTPTNDLIDLKANVWATDVRGTTRVASSSIYYAPYIYPADEPRYARVFTHGANVTNTSKTELADMGLRLNYGASYLHENMDGDQYCSRIATRYPCVIMNPSVGTREVMGVFANADLDLSTSLTLNTSLHYDAWRLQDNSEGALPEDSKRDGGRLNPSVGLTWEPLHGLQLFGKYAEGVRPPTLRETMGSDANAIPNPDLEAEEAFTYEIGVNYLHNDILDDDDTLGLKVTAFKNNVENYISRVYSYAGAGQPFFGFTNIEKVSYTGLEFSGRYDSSLVFAEASVTKYIDYEFCHTEGCKDVTVTVDYAANHVPPGLNWSVTGGLKLLDEKLRIGGTLTYAGPRLAPVTRDDRFRTANWAPYTVADLFASYDFDKTAQIGLKVENLTDRYYVDALDGWTPAPGRTIQLNLTTWF